MSSEKASSEEKTNEQMDAEAQRLEEAIAKIKQPAPINEALKELSPEELTSNPTIVPEMLQDRGDLRHDLTRDK